jgi:hypothetical protein
MALVVKDRVQETSTTTGTGSLTLLGAVTGFQTFSSAIGNTNTTYYTIQNGAEWEVGIGTVSAGTLSRDTVLESSNGGSLVNFSAGTKFVFCTYPAEKSVYYDASNNVNIDITGNAATVTNGVYTSDIGTTVQAYDADTTKNDVANTFTANQVISVTDNTNAALRVTQLGTGNALVVEDSTNPDSTPFVIDANGQVGIGTSSPSSLGKLAVVGGNVVANGGGTQDPEFRLNGASGGVTRNYAMGTDNAQRLYWYDYTASAYRMVIDSSGNVGIGTSSPQLNLDVANANDTQIRARATTNGIDLRMYALGLTGNAGIIGTYSNHPLVLNSNSAERMRIDASGNVGIGTSSPGARLEVSSSETSGRILLNAVDLPMITNGFDKFTSGAYIGAGRWGMFMEPFQLTLGCSTNGNFTFKHFNADSTSTERMRIDSSGNVGIGTSSPNAKLEVYGQRVRINATPDPGIEFANTSAVKGYVFYDTTNDVVTMRHASNSGINVTSTGDLQFNSGYGSAATAYGCRAWVNFDGTSNTANLTGTYSQTGTTVTVTITNHGYITGNRAFLDFTSGTAVDGSYEVTVTGANTFTVTQASRTTSGNVTAIKNTIRASGNVSSISDNGIGDYTVNFTRAMPNENYSISGMSEFNGLQLASPFLYTDAGTPYVLTTNAFRFQNQRVGSGTRDLKYVYLQVFA